MVAFPYGLHRATMMPPSAGRSGTASVVSAMPHAFPNMRSCRRFSIGPGCRSVSRFTLFRSSASSAALASAAACALFSFSSRSYSAATCRLITSGSSATGLPVAGDVAPPWTSCWTTLDRASTCCPSWATLSALAASLPGTAGASGPVLSSAIVACLPEPRAQLPGAIEQAGGAAERAAVLAEKLRDRQDQRVRVSDHAAERLNVREHAVHGLV